jgi:protein gp37
MSKTTKIEWTDKTWNPVTGCTKISAGCANCYAEVMSRRLCAMGQHKYRNGFKLTIHDNALEEPLNWKKPHMVFVCSMGDLFHEEVPFEFIDKVMETMQATPQHTYQVLTKRALQMATYFKDRVIPDNVWVGVTVDVINSKERIDYLRHINAPIRFLSCEPLLEDLGDLDIENINWVIVGGESGGRARPMKEEWVLSIKKQADGLSIPFFFKQWGTWGCDGVKRNKKVNGKLLQGKIYQSMPLHTQIESEKS